MKLIKRNSYTQVVDAEPYVLEAIARECTLVYEFWTRRRGAPKPKRDERELCYLNKKNGFPAGWTDQIIERLKRLEVPVDIEDRRNYPEVVGLPLQALPDEPWEHQSNALKAATESERGIIQVPTRGGKTLIMGLCTAQFSVRTLVLVPNKLLLDQEFQLFSRIFGEDKVGCVGGGKNEYDRPLIIATVQTMYRRLGQPRTVKLFRSVGCLLIDECHHIKHGGYKLQNTYFEICQRFKSARFRLGFTATPGSTKSLERRFLEGVTGPLIFSENIATLTKKGIITPAKVLIIPIDLPKTRTLRDILWDDHQIDLLPNEDVEAAFRNKGLQVPSIPSFSQQLKLKVTENPIIRELIKTIAEHFSLCYNRSVIVMVSRVEQGVDAFTSGQFAIRGAEGLSGKDTDVQRQDVLTRFKTGELKVLVSTLVREGVDIPKADVIIMAAADVKSATPVIQRAGRVLTKDPGKDQATIVDFFFRDRGVLRKHSRERMLVYAEQGWDLEVFEREDFERVRQEVALV
ncbi:MAG: or RNA helicase of superfamily II protein [Candidatus Gottesmanbacteria bacterium GW2011_GWB1_49_7]|uniref:Or RNA helicase of superfamily II protein n=1 Tax=Candidatus Gottesmanbacteria bacterium GW2011_GWB1_49_7 TaxID=1618448 RepID=A0A0G1YXC6_9BACT|nr:MAG: or RNA helicase of superfamily II protein [Candidatus Gottesmanbacteria bacterium GW2011_GWB1_49_7]